MTRLALGLQTLANLDEPLVSKLDRVGKTAFEGVQFDGLSGDDPALVRERLDANSLEPAGAYTTLDQLEGDYEAIVEQYRNLGVERLTLLPFPDQAFESRETITAFVKRVMTAGKRLEDNGFTLSYSNSTAEFNELGGEVTFQTLLDGLDDRITLELNVGLAMYGGVDPIKLVENYGGRISAIHVTDTVPGTENTEQVELGAGEVDVERIVDVAKHFDVEWLVYNYGQTKSPEDSLIHGGTKLTSLLGEKTISTDSA